MVPGPGKLLPSHIHWHHGSFTPVCSLSTWTSSRDLDSNCNPFLQFDDARIKYQLKVFDSHYSVSARRRWWGKVIVTTATGWTGAGGGAQFVNTILVLFNCNIDPRPQWPRCTLLLPSTRLLKLTAQLGPVDQWISVARCGDPGGLSAQ